MWNQDSTGTRTRSNWPESDGGRGWFGTVGGSCDYQIGERWVVSVFGDYDFASTRSFAASFGDVCWIGGLKSAWAVAPHRIPDPPAVLTFISGGVTEARFSNVDLAFHCPVDPLVLS